MATEFNDDQHYALFKGPGAIRTGNSFEVRWSEITLASLRSAGFLDNMIDSTVPPSIDKLWLDKNTDPASLKEWSPVNAAWVDVTASTFFGRVRITLASDVGTGSANAIQAVTNTPVGESALIFMPILETNSGSPVTVSFNGGPSLRITTNSGDDPIAGSLTAGSIVAGIVQGAQFRLLSDLASSAVLQGAMDAKSAAEAARDEAVETAGLLEDLYSIPSPETYGPITLTLGQSTVAVPDGYEPGADMITVKLDGVELSEGEDFTASDGASIVLTVPIAEDDIAEDPDTGDPIPPVMYITRTRQIPAGTRGLDTRYVKASNYNRLSIIQVTDRRFFPNGILLDDVMSMDASIDVAAEFQAAVNYAEQEGYILHIPRLGALLGARIAHTSKLNVECDDHAFLHWTNIASCGWKVIGDVPSGSPGYGHIHLPQLIGPNDISGYTGNAATNDYSVKLFAGTAFEIEDWIWGKFRIHQTKGWGTSLKVTADVLGSFNLDIDVGTIDLCHTGIHLAGKNGKVVGQSKISADNIFCLFPIHLDSSGGNVFEWTIRALGYVVAEDDGMCINHTGAGISDVRTFGKAVNGYSPVDSPSSTATDMRGVLIGGNATGPAGEPGWANGTRNVHELHLDHWYPQAGDPIAVKLRGPGSKAVVSCPTESPEDPLATKALSTTQGEEHFNGGIGGAAVHDITRVSCSLPSLAGGAVSDWFYFYHQRLNPDSFLPPTIYNTDNIGLIPQIESQATDVPRQARIRFFNPTASATSPQTVNVRLLVH